MSKGDYLPRADARDGRRAADGPDGRALRSPEKAVVAGDVRANENVALTAIHTLFAREHNRIVAALSRSGLSDEDKFQTRAARCRSGDRIHHVQRVSACARRSGSTPIAATTRT